VLEKIHARFRLGCIEYVLAAVDSRGDTAAVASEFDIFSLAVYFYN